MIINELKKQWRLLLGFVVFTIFNAFLSLLLIALIQDEVGLVGQSDDYSSRLAIFAACTLGLFVCGIVAQHSVTLFSTHIVKRLRMVLTTKLLALNFREMEILQPHKVQATLANDITGLARAMLIFPALLSNSLLVILCFGYLAFLSFKSFLILITVIGVGLIVTNLIMSRAAIHLNKVRQIEDDLFKNYRGLTEGAKELNLNPPAKQHFLANEIHPAVENIRGTEIKGQLLFNVSTNWTNILVFLALGSVVFSSHMLGHLAMNEMVAYVLVTIYLIGPLGMMINNAEGCFRGVVAYKKIQSLGIDLTEDLPLDNPTVDLSSNPLNEQKWSQMQFKDCQFHYVTDKQDDSGFSVGPVDFHINRSEVLFVIGGNGSGKSTFAKIFTQLYIPQQGQVSLINAQGQACEHKQLQVAAIFADFFLFDWLIDSKGQAADKAIVDKYLQRMGLEKKVSYDNGHLSTTELSSGQRKRLALVQALLLDPDVYLFDEWAADQDGHYRHFFYRELLPELSNAGKTVIVISHDDHFFDAADRIVKFDQGQVESINLVSKSADNQPQPA